MIYAISLAAVCALAWFIGTYGARLGIPVWLLVFISAMLGFLIMHAVSSSQAQAVPIDAEAFKTPVKYRECRPLTWDDVQTGKDVLPLPPSCVLTPPAKRASVKTTPPDVNPFTQYAHQ